jgi:hypothetical protein
MHTSPLTQELRIEEEDIDQMLRTVHTPKEFIKTMIAIDTI